MRVVILGGGISGLLAAHVLRKHKPTLLEAQPKLGGNYTAGGLKYIRRTARFEALLGELDIHRTLYQPKGVLYFDGQLHPHPSWLMEQPGWGRRAIQSAHWVKTRGLETSVSDTCMNDPAGEGADVAMRCDHALLLLNLCGSASMAGAELATGVRVEHVSSESVVCSDRMVPYDRMVTTAPLSVMSRLAPWAGLPAPKPNDLSIMDLEDAGMSTVQWDYMYTPTLPTISRISPTHRPGKPQAYQVEAPGCPDPRMMFNEAVEAISHAVGGSKLEVMGDVRVIPGHLKPLNNPVAWPESWLPLGRFAEWEPRATAEKVLDKVSLWADTL